MRKAAAAARERSSSSRRRHRRQPDSGAESESESGSPSKSDYTSDSSPDRCRRRNCHWSSRWQRSASPDSGSERDRKKSNRKITDEEIKEYLPKKAQKNAMRVAKKLKMRTVSGYSNDSNPFGDSNLNEKFVWRKKIERDVQQGVLLDEYSVRAEKKKQRERMAEIEKVKKQREERALEKAQREEQMMMLQRERARGEADNFDKKEEEFHFDQSKVRSRIQLLGAGLSPWTCLPSISMSLMSSTLNWMSLTWVLRA